MDDKKEAFFGDSVDLLEKALENSEPENPDEIEVVEVRKPNRHERRKRAKLARIMASKEKVEPSKRVIRQKLKGEK
jgi:hypothetical protein